MGRRGAALCTYVLLFFVSLLVVSPALISHAGEAEDPVRNGSNRLSLAEPPLLIDPGSVNDSEKAANQWGDVSVEDDGEAIDGQEAGLSRDVGPEEYEEYADVGLEEWGEVEATREELGEERLIADPFETMNRFFFAFNDRLYFWLLKPAAQAYRRIIPEDFRVVFGNFYRNIGAPARIANNILQLKGRQAGTEILRFVLNSALGAGGLRDVARDVFAVDPAPEDLGQTLGFYGFNPGFYLVLPVLGPSSARDGLGMAGDLYLNPITYLDPTELRYGLRTHDRVNDVSFRIGDYEAFKKAALDPYIAMREAYAANRAAEIKK